MAHAAREPVQLDADSDGAAVDTFGSSVALADGVALLGAPASDVAGNTAQGAAYVFRLAPISNVPGGLWLGEGLEERRHHPEGVGPGGGPLRRLQAGLHAPFSPKGRRLVESGK